jgi:hypothetical protein
MENKKPAGCSAGFFGLNLQPPVFVLLKKAPDGLFPLPGRFFPHFTKLNRQAEGFFFALVVVEV